MTIRLVNAYTSHNLGDALIYETLVQLSGKLGANSGMPTTSSAHVRGLLDKQLGSSAYVSVGGDIFNNARPWFFTRRFIELVQELSECDPRKTFVFGQGLPTSCRNASFFWLAHVFKRLSSVTVRDKESYLRLRSVGVNNCQLGYDTVFAYQRGPHVDLAGRRLMERSGVEPGKAILFSVREFDAMYPQDGLRFETKMSILIQKLKKRGHQPAVLVQAQAQGADADDKVIERLRKSYPELPILNPFHLQNEGYHPIDSLLGAIGLAAGVIAIRYHTAILRMLYGRMPYNLYYSSKGRDLSERLHVPGRNLATFDPEAILVELEAAMNGHFSIQSIADQVKDQFANALHKAIQA